MLIEELERQAIALHEAPMTAGWGNIKGFGCCNGIICCVCGCGRACLVIVAEGIEYGACHLAGKIDHIIIAKGSHPDIDGIVVSFLGT